jgi:signal transduction histidine kinase/ligand-binding sensor domain-containing protein/CheY-like chemotaxis protein/AraC-like DNA-binding protein
MITFAFMKGSHMRRGFLMLFLAGLTAISMASGWTFERITTQDGLSENHINGLFQDSRGFLWIGTNDGLNRYDGYQFKTYQMDAGDPHSLQSNLIFDIIEDREGDLWIGTTDKGVYRYDYSLETFEKISDNQTGPSTISDRVNQLLLHGNNIIVGMYDGVVAIKPDGDHYSFEKIRPFPESSEEFILRRLAEKNEESFWMASQLGLHLVSRDSSGSYSVRNCFHPEGITIRTLTTHEHGVFIGSNEGTYYYNEDIGYHKINDLDASSILFDRENNMWLAADEGLYILAKDHEKPLFWKEINVGTKGPGPGSLSSDRITDLMEDYNGNVWIGTLHGINKYNPNRKPFQLFGKEGHTGNIWGEHIRSIYEDRYRNIWIGTDGGGISLLPRRSALNKEFSEFKLLPENLSGGLTTGYAIHEIRFEDKDYLFIGSNFPSKLAMFEMKAGLPSARVPLPSELEAIQGMVFTLVDDGDLIWFGTYDQGLCRFHKTSRELTTYTQSPWNGLASNIIRDLLVDREGNLWIGTGDGLNVVTREDKNKEEPEFNLYVSNSQDTSSISHNYILTLFESSDGAIWVGTMGGGLNRYLGYGDFEVIDVRDGLPNNVVKGILEDGDGNLWISSNKGLSKMNPGNGTISNFDLYDGLQDFEFGEHACAKLHDGQMIFGGMSGFNAFYPDDIRTETTLPKMAFTDFQVLHQSIKVGETVKGRVLLDKNLNEIEQLRLGNQLSSFSIHFAALHYSASPKNLYRYKLEGFDEDWIHTDSRTTFARYTNLKPGSYTFKVMGSNNDGLWNPEPLILDIRIVPPFWASWMAFIIYTLLFLVGAWFFNRYTFIRIKEKNKLVMEHFEREKIQELSRMKLKFYTNISHEFRTPLTLIIGQMQSLIKNIENLGFEKIKQKNLIIFRNAKVLLRLINQLMDFRKLEQDKMVLNASRSNFYLFLKEIYESFEEMAFQKEIDFKFKSYSRNIDLWYDPEKIEKIFYNLLSNAFNYTKKCGSIEFSIKDHSDEYVLISIADTGVGIPEDIQEHIFERFYQAKEIRNRNVGSTGIGLALTKGLVDLHSGKIEFTSKRGAGTTFNVYLPKGELHLDDSQKMMEEVDEVGSAKSSPIIILPELNEEQDDKTLKPAIQEKILIVEDNQDLRGFLHESLTENFHVQSTLDGKDALECLEWFEPSLVITDIKMPRMDGIELCKHLKSNENTSHIPVMMLTSKTSEEAQIEGYEAGADAYVSKPFNMEVLSAQIRSILRRKDDFHQDYKKDIEFTLEDDALTQLDKKLLRRTRELIEQNIMDPDYSVIRLAQDYGLSQDNLNKKLKALIGMTAKSYIRSVKLKRAARLLATGRYTVAEVTYDVGFSDLKYFRKAFKNEFDVSPSEFKSLKA